MPLLGRFNRSFSTASTGQFLRLAINECHTPLFPKIFSHVLDEEFVDGFCLHKTMASRQLMERPIQLRHDEYVDGEESNLSDRPESDDEQSQPDESDQGDSHSEQEVPRHTPDHWGALTRCRTPISPL